MSKNFEKHLNLYNNRLPYFWIAFFLGNVDNEVLLNWISEQLRNHEDITITDIGSIFKNGKILCAIIHHYRPDLLDYSAIKDEDPAKNNQLAFDVLEKELGNNLVKNRRQFFL